MPTIAVASSKGGAGKTTTSLVLGTTIAAHGAKGVSILDCDPNQPLKAWRDGESQSPARVVSNLSENTIIDAIEDEGRQSQFVVIDLEGTASRMVSRAISRADLILIPLKATQLDARQAARTVALIREEERVLRRSLPYRIVFTMTSPQIPTRNEKLIATELSRTGHPVLSTHLNLRAAFASIFTYRVTVAELNPALVNGVDAAVKNADDFAAEVVATLRDVRQGRAA